MQPARSVTVRVHPDGRVEVETDGFVGPSCADVALRIAGAVTGTDDGGDDLQIDHKPAYYMTEEGLTESDDVHGDR